MLGLKSCQIVYPQQTICNFDKLLIDHHLIFRTPSLAGAEAALTKKQSFIGRIRQRENHQINLNTVLKRRTGMLSRADTRVLVTQE